MTRTMRCRVGRLECLCTSNAGVVCDQIPCQECNFSDTEIHPFPLAKPYPLLSSGTVNPSRPERALSASIEPLKRSPCTFVLPYSSLLQVDVSYPSSRRLRSPS